MPLASMLTVRFGGCPEEELGGVEGGAVEDVVGGEEGVLAAEERARKAWGYSEGGDFWLLRMRREGRKGGWEWEWEWWG